MATMTTELPTSWRNLEHVLNLGLAADILSGYGWGYGEVDDEDVMTVLEDIDFKGFCIFMRAYDKANTRKPCENYGCSGYGQFLHLYGGIKVCQSCFNAFNE